jgi:uncharacterized phage-associated protein
MTSLNYIEYNKDQMSKIGNTIIYFANSIQDLTKTKLLKLLYILDEFSISNSGIPFLNLQYKVWKYGPVSEDIFVDLSETPVLLKEFIKKKHDNDNNGFIKPINSFNDDEFSDNDIAVLDDVILNFGSKSVSELIDYTHRPNAPWYKAAKENLVLELLENEKINCTEFIIDMS